MREPVDSRLRCKRSFWGEEEGEPKQALNKGSCGLPPPPLPPPQARMITGMCVRHTMFAHPVTQFPRARKDYMVGVPAELFGAFVDINVTHQNASSLHDKLTCVLPCAVSYNSGCTFPQCIKCIGQASGQQVNRSWRHQRGKYTFISTVPLPLHSKGLEDYHHLKMALVHFHARNIYCWTFF